MAENTAGTTSASDDGQHDAGSEPLGDGGKRALEAERKARREAEQRAKQAEDRATELEAQDLRREVATEKGLTSAQAKRLAGSTREELETDADDLLDAFGGSSAGESGAGRAPKRMPRDPNELREGTVPNAGQQQDMSELAGRIYSG